MQLHQLVVTARPGDAITNAALELRKLLRRVGPSEIYAKNIHPSLARDVQPLRAFVRRRSGAPRDDLLLFHASIGDPEVHSLVMSQPERLVLVYHNISPAEAFLDYDPGFAGMLEGGRRELAAMAERASMAIAVSEFNARELRELGYHDVRVSPLVVDIAGRLATAPDEHLAAELDRWGGPLVLFVGQVLPHKRPDFLLQAFHVLQTFHRPDAHLAIAGNLGLVRYAHCIRQLGRELNLHRLLLTGAITDAQLVALYRRADLFVTASEHEGLCVPLLEAMAFGVPIVARGCAAIPDTLGDAGVLLPVDSGPTLMAEAMAAVLDDEGLQADLAQRGRFRVSTFDPDGARASFVGHLLEAV